MAVGRIVHRQEVFGKFYRGPAVITNMGVFRFDDDGIMYLDTVHRASPRTGEDNCSFDLNISRCRGKEPTDRGEIYLAV